MILHTLNASPASPAFRDCIRVAANNDAILLLGDGVYAALPDTVACNALLAAGVEVYVLDSAAKAAGVTALPVDVQRVDMNGFVELTERFARQQAWY